jgi:mono/diheme cytochrome c family protein
MKHTASMKMGTLLSACACALLSAAFALAADDGAALFKSRCAGCHGAQGEGKPAMNAPSLKTTKMDATQITEHLTKGESGSKPPHNKGISGLKPDQAKAIAEYVKTLQ